MLTKEKIRVLEENVHLFPQLPNLSASCLVFKVQKDTGALKECKVSWGEANNNVKKIDDNKSLKDEFSKEQEKVFQSRKKSTFTNKIEGEDGWHKNGPLYAAFLSVSFFSHYTTPHISLKGKLSHTLDHLQPLGASGQAGEKLTRVSKTHVTSPRTQEGVLGSCGPAAPSSRGHSWPKVSSQSQFLQLPRPLPLLSRLRALRAGKQGKPIDISGINYSTLRRRRQSPQSSLQIAERKLRQCCSIRRFAGGRSQARAETMVRWIPSLGRVEKEVRGWGVRGSFFSCLPQSCPGPWDLGTVADWMVQAVIQHVRPGRESGGRQSVLPVRPFPGVCFAFHRALNSIFSVYQQISLLRFLQSSRFRAVQRGPQWSVWEKGKIGT